MSIHENLPHYNLGDEVSLETLHEIMEFMFTQLEYLADPARPGDELDKDGTIHFMLCMCMTIGAIIQGHYPDMKTRESRAQQMNQLIYAAACLAKPANLPKQIDMN